MGDMRLTHHGRQRIRERVGVGKSDRKVERAAQIAWERGLHHSDFKGGFKKYLSEMYLEYQCGNNMRIHAGQIWIFQDSKLVTVKPIPPKYARKYRDYLKKGMIDEG